MPYEKNSGEMKAQSREQWQEVICEWASRQRDELCRFKTRDDFLEKVSLRNSHTGLSFPQDVTGKFDNIFVKLFKNNVK